ncbi:MAG TPA: hypothetical protein PL009_11260 [Flavipsychrobacter sp.]|nr:hypothetical protein [Flavipsychrobacter sp.]
MIIIFAFASCEPAVKKTAPSTWHPTVQPISTSEQEENTNPQSFIKDRFAFIKLVYEKELKTEYKVEPLYQQNDRPKTVPFDIIVYVTEIKEISTLTEEEEARTFDKLEESCHPVDPRSNIKLINKSVSYFSSYKEASDSIHKVVGRQTCYGW